MRAPVYRGLRTLARARPRGHSTSKASRATGSRATSPRPRPSTSSTAAASPSSLPSRTDSDNRLLGAKHRAAQEREVTVAVGGRDGRRLILVPEIDAGCVCGITLLHVQFREALAPAETRRVLEGYRDRYAALVDAVTETEAAFSDERFEQVPSSTC